MRDRSAIDMSHNIRQFCQEHGIGVPPDAPADPPAFPSTFHKDTHHDRHSKSQPRAAKMEDTTFNDLFLRVSCTSLLPLECMCIAIHSQCSCWPGTCLNVLLLMMLSLILALHTTGSISMLSRLPSEELAPALPVEGQLAKLVLLCALHNRWCLVSPYLWCFTWL